MRYDKLTKKDIFIITNIIFVAIIFIYELFYCNFEYFFNGIKNYNLSIYRFIAYAVIYLLIYKFKDEFIDSAIEAFKIKQKGYLFNITILVELFVLIFLTSKIGMYIIILSIAMLLLLLFSIYISKDMIKNLIVTALTFGIIFSITIPFNNQLDEKRHFLASYNLATGNFDLKNPTIYKCTSEMPMNIRIHNFITYFSINPTNEVMEEPENIGDTANDYITVSYIISGIGIFIAKILGGSLADIYITGRIFNLLGYTFIIVKAMKILPYKKNIAYSILFMPMLLALASVYSVDGIGTALALLFIAYCLKLNEQDEINIKEVIKLSILLVLAATIKNIGYIGIGLVVFILPLKKIIKQNKKYLKYFIAILLLLLICIAFVAKNEISKKGDPRVQDVNTSEQLKIIINNPITYSKILLTHMKYSLTKIDYISFINAPMFFYNTYYNIFLIMTGYQLFISITDSSKHLKVKNRLIFLFTFFAVYAMISTIMYLAFTRVGAGYISGVQSRYIFPIIFLILSSISIKKLELDYNKFKGINLYTAYISAIFLIVSVFDLII